MEGHSKGKGPDTADKGRRKRARSEADPAASEAADASDASDASNASDSDADTAVNETVNLEFTAYAPKEGDYYGIKHLLQQVFANTPVNLTELADLIVAQSHVGSVVKILDEETVYGVFTVINLHEHKDKECVRQIKTHLLSQCKDDAVKQRTAAILESSAQPSGLIISERFVNVPPDVAPPLHTALATEMADARKKGEAFSFGHLVFIMKAYTEIAERVTSADGERDLSKLAKKMRKMSKKNAAEMNFINAEDELVQQMSDLSFTYRVKGESSQFLDETKVHLQRVVCTLPFARHAQLMAAIEAVIV